MQNEKKSPADKTKKKTSDESKQISTSSKGSSDKIEHKDEPSKNDLPEIEELFKRFLKLTTNRSRASTKSSNKTKKLPKKASEWKNKLQKKIKPSTKISKLYSQKKLPFKFTTKPLILILIVIGVIAWIVSGFYTVLPKQQALVLRFGKYIATKHQGKHWYPRFVEQIYIQNTDTIYKIYNSKQVFLSKNNIVKVTYNAKYHITNLKNYLFNSNQPAQILQQSLSAIITQILVSNKPVSTNNWNKAQISTKVLQKLETAIKHYKLGIKITKLSILSINLPNVVVKTELHIEQKKKELNALRPSTKSNVNNILMSAKEKAKSIIARAKFNQKQSILEANAFAHNFSNILPKYIEHPKFVTQQIYYASMKRALKLDQIKSGNLNSINPYVYNRKLINKNLFQNQKIKSSGTQKSKHLLQQTKLQKKQLLEYARWQEAKNA